MYMYESRTIEVKNRYVYESPTIYVTNYKRLKRCCTERDGGLEGRDGGDRLIKPA